jgi:hypothetical protein
MPPARPRRSVGSLRSSRFVQRRNATRRPRPFRREAGRWETSLEAMRALQRRLRNVVYAQILEDQKLREAGVPGGHSGTTLHSGTTDLTPDIGSLDKPLPEPPRQSLSPRSRRCLDTNGRHMRTDVGGGTPASSLRRCSTEYDCDAPVPGGLAKVWGRWREGIGR